MPVQLSHLRRPTRPKETQRSRVGLRTERGQESFTNDSLGVTVQSQRSQCRCHSYNGDSTPVLTFSSVYDSRQCLQLKFFSEIIVNSSLFVILRVKIEDKTLAPSRSSRPTRSRDLLMSQRPTVVTGTRQRRGSTRGLFVDHDQLSRCGIRFRYKSRRNRNLTV